VKHPPKDPASGDRFDVAVTCVAKLKTHTSYNWVLISKSNAELNWRSPGTLPVATLMMQLLTPTS
jgi:hypothetical protein